MKKIGGVTAGDLIGATMVARARVQVFDSAMKPSYVVNTGDIIGVVYSYVERVSDGKLLWMFYRNNSDFVNFRPSYVVNDSSKISIPLYKEKLDDLNRKREAEIKEEKGGVQYNIDKYLPWVIGAVTVGLVAPSFFKNKISGMNSKKDFLVIGALGFLVWKYGKPRYKTTLSFDLDEGEFVSSANQGDVAEVQLSSPALISPSSSVKIKSVGPFRVEYDTKGVSGRRDIGRTKFI